MKTFAIIPAGGKGTRSGFSAPKQYLKFNKKELIVYTLLIFQRNREIDEIVVAVDPSYIKRIKEIKGKYRLSKITGIVEGGETRQDSVYNALLSIKAEKKDLIAVHDAARPFLPQEILSNAINTAKEKGNAVVCIKARDTLVIGKDKINSFLDRNEVFYVQTPQIFTYSNLLRAEQKAKKNNFYGTDESMLVKQTGKKVNIVEGSPINFKVTTKSDIQIVKKLLKQ